MISTENLISQQKDRDVKVVSHTFQVSDVEKNKSVIRGLPYDRIIHQKMVNPQPVVIGRRKPRTTSPLQPEKASKKTLEATAKKNIRLGQTLFHPFIATLHHAYDKHYPVTISPDMIWLLIAQGFADHVNENGEAMRNYFVDFEGKKNLDVRRDEFVKGSPNNDWKGVFAEFGVQIQENIGADLLELVTGDFSTTTAFEKAAFQVTLMDAMKSYFTYSVTTMCGIPEVTLEGTAEDWQMVEKKAQQLAQYDLEGWIDTLMPVLQEFTAAAKGEVDKDFWKSIYKWNHMGSGSPFITGWILKFFPYMKSGSRSYPFAIKFKEPTSDEKRTYRLSATTDKLPSGLSKVDFIWNYLGTFYSMEFAAGFVGFHQDPKTFSLRPEISWAVIDKNEEPTKERIEGYCKGGDKDYLKSIDK